jgi:hypothetical protein
LQSSWTRVHVAQRTLALAKSSLRWASLPWARTRRRIHWNVRVRIVWHRRWWNKESRYPVKPEDEYVWTRREQRNSKSCTITWHVGTCRTRVDRPNYDEMIITNIYYITTNVNKHESDMSQLRVNYESTASRAVEIQLPQGLPVVSVQSQAKDFCCTSMAL